MLIYLAKPDLLDSTLRDFFGDQRFVPICPDDRLYLSVRGHGDDARFAGIFRDAWLNIPLEDRMQIIEYSRPISAFRRARDQNHDGEPIVHAFSGDNRRL